ncbi:4Fe-4S cluster-binding domain-containing protein, partial [Streptomyces sp. NPDC057540]|uniref:4Fe-4S cluster-binding domain-containing protein n=1 Tax=Streptomyces sp. NPDC057540 TaxID=3346160 RepID=UPI00368ED2FF
MTSATAPATSPARQAASQARTPVTSQVRTPDASPARTPAAVATQRPSEGSVHSWDLSTGVDGPGTRFVTFLSGCPLTCLYCHNPDTWRMRNGTRTSAD